MWEHAVEAFGRLCSLNLVVTLQVLSADAELQSQLDTDKLS